MLVRLTVILALALLPLPGAPPNIIFILPDDMGYGDVQALNPDSPIPTPHLNHLATQGITFTDAHTPSAVCTPTRYGLLTGRYAWRTRLKKGVLNGYGEPLIEPGRQTVASFLQRHGYHTGMVGKWHLGLGFAKTADGSFDFSKPVSDGPHTRGFKYSFIIPASLDFPPYIYIRDGAIERFPLVTQPAQKFPAFLRRGERQSDLIMENVLDDLAFEAVRYIKQRSAVDQPFFLYLALTAPHKPVLPHRRFRDRTTAGPYGDFVAQVDATVGDVIKAVDNSGAADNTLLIYTSDNGSFMYRLDRSDNVDHVDDETIQAYRSDRHRANHVFRGTKADIWEAGHHVPFFARWPGRIEPGSKAEDTICLTDFFSTVSEIVGEDLPDEAAEDSFSFLNQIKGGRKKTPRAPVIHHSSRGMFAVREGKWKLVLGNGSGGREKPVGVPFGKPYQLFDLSADIGERTNVIAQNAEVAERLEKAFADLRSKGRSR